MGEEAKLQAKIMTWFNSFGDNVVPFKIADKFTVGIPDVLVCFFGVFVAVEVKAPKGKLSAMQKHRLETIRKSGGYAYVVRTFKEFLECMEKTHKKTITEQEALIRQGLRIRRFPRSLDSSRSV